MHFLAIVHMTQIIGHHDLHRLTNDGFGYLGLHPGTIIFIDWRKEEI